MKTSYSLELICLALLFQAVVIFTVSSGNREKNPVNPVDPVKKNLK